MKEIEKASISGIGFQMDRDAYKALEDYLTRLHRIYDKDPDGGEIIADIEARMAEIILSKQDMDRVVSLSLVSDIIERLGVPEAESAEDKGPAQTFPRRLYRNPEGSKLGGVCSGLGTFFDIDPVWIRIGAFAPLILLIITAPLGSGALSSFFGVMTGVIPLVYLMLWFAVPPASTPRQRLEMRGERITASAIESNLRQSAPRNERSQRNATVWAEIIYILGRIALFCIKAVALFVAIGLIIASVAMFVAAGAVLTNVNKPVFNHMQLADYLPSLAGITPEWYVVISILVVLIPIVMVVVLLFRLIFERGVNGKTLSVLGGIWLIITIYWGIVTVSNAEELYDNIRYGDRKEMVKPLTLKEIPAVADTIEVPVINDSI